MKFNAIYSALLVSVLGVSVSSALDPAPVVAPKKEVVPIGPIVPGKLVSISLEDKVYKIESANGVKFELRFLADDVFRILAAPKGNFADPKNDAQKAQIVIKKEVFIKTNKMETKDAVVITTAKGKLTISKKDCAIKLQNTAGEVLFSETTPLSFSKDKTIQTLASSREERFYGGGQQNGFFAHKGTKIEIRADGNWNEGGKPNPAPYYLSSQGYGVLRNTFSTGEYDFELDSKIKLSHKENRFDAYYFIGGMKQVVNLYTDLTGRPNFVPIWALELGEADAYMTRDKKTKELLKNEDGSFVEITPDCIPRLAEKYREHDMPGGWILPNDGYGCGYVDLPEVVQKLKNLGFYTGLWTESDLTKTDWEVGEAGIRVQKLDVAWTGPAYQFSLDANKKAWTSLTTNSESRGFVWTVQGWAGTQRYAVCWTGDQYGSWDLIRYHIPTLIGSGLSGQAYATTDVDGIFGGSPETYTRDLQWKCFTPVLYAMNGWAGDISKSPWAYEEPYRSINRRYLKLKMRLTPYMYKYTREAYDTGAPIVRGMLWEFPKDPKTWGRDTEYQYMLGESILVAPVYTSMKSSRGWRKEDIYLPEGTWFDYSDGRRIVGATTIDAYPVTLDKLPVFIRGGGIIPMYPEMLYNNQKPKDPLTFDIYPHGSSSFELYEDDGLTKKYQNGESSKQLVTCVAPEGKAGDIRVTIGKAVGDYENKPKDRVYQLQVRSDVRPDGVKVGGDNLKELESLSSYNEAKSGWYYAADERRGTVHVRLERSSTEKKYDILIDIDEDKQLLALEPYPVPKPRHDLDGSELTVTASSEIANSPIMNAFDGTPETMWHSAYGNKKGKFPYTVDVNLNGLYAINGISYLARQAGTNGLLKDYEVYVSRSPSEMGNKVATGTFTRSTDLQKVKFPVKWGEHVKMVFLNDHIGSSHAAAGELGVLRALNVPPLAEEITYLSDLKPASSKGTFKMDQSAGGKTITVNDQTYKKGIGAISGSELVYKLDGSWDVLSGNVGMDDEVGDAGSVMFRVYADGKIIFESPEQTGKSIKQLMVLDVKGVKELRLVLLPLDDGSENDHGDWVDAKLVRKGSE